MLTRDSDTSKKTPRLKEDKSVGYLILLNKRKFNKLKEKQTATFIDAIGKLNKSLKKSESLVNLPSYIKRNNSVIKLFEHKEEIIKKRKLKFESLPDINKNSNNKTAPINKGMFSSKALTSNKLINFNKQNIIPISPKNETEEKIPFYYKSLKFSKHNKTAAEIVKTSKNVLYGKTPFKKYCYNLEENVGDYVQSKEKHFDYSNFYEILKGYIKDELTGISIPGNLLNRAVPGYIRSIHPKNVRTRIKKRIDVPDKTLVPTPNELVGKGISYSHITMKDIYNDKNLLI